MASLVRGLLGWKAAWTGAAAVNMAELIFPKDEPTIAVEEREEKWLKN